MQIHKDDLPALAQVLLSYAKEGQSESAFVFALSGPLGAGKTTLVQHIARALGVSTFVPSPTFVIMRAYPTKDPVFSRLVHIDAYRIENERELAPLHLADEFEKQGTLVCVEWPEKLGQALPTGATFLKLAHISEDEREMVGGGDIEVYVGDALQK